VVKASRPDRVVGPFCHRVKNSQLQGRGQSRHRDGVKPEKRASAHFAKPRQASVWGRWSWGKREVVAKTVWAKTSFRRSGFQKTKKKLRDTNTAFTKRRIAASCERGNQSEESKGARDVISKAKERYVDKAGIVWKGGRKARSLGFTCMRFGQILTAGKGGSTQQSVTGGWGFNS